MGTGGLDSIVSYSRPSLMIIVSRTQFHIYYLNAHYYRFLIVKAIAPATLVLTPGPTGLTFISHKAARRQPKVGTDQATQIQDVDNKGR